MPYPANAGGLQSQVRALVKQDLHENWMEVASELSMVFSAKAGQDVKNALAKSIGALAIESLDSFNKCVDFVAARSKSTKRDEERALLLKSLYEALLSVREANIVLPEESIQYAIGFTKRYFETNESPSEVLPLLDICLFIAKQYPTIFAQHLHDICDFTIGWYIDRSQPRFVEKKCGDMLAAFGPFFVDDIGEAVSFMRSLIDDCFFALERLINGQNNDEEDFASWTPTLEAFTIIFEHSVSPSNIDAMEPLVVSILEQLEKKLPKMERLPAEGIGPFYVKTARILAMIHSLTGDQRALEGIGIFLQTALQNPTVSVHCVTALLQIVAKMIDETDDFALRNTWMSTLADQALLSKMLSNKEIHLALTTVLSKLLDPTDFTGLQALYEQLVALIQNLSESLCEWTSGVSSLAFEVVKNTEQLFCLCISALRPLAGVKNSIVVLMGLTPSLFSLFFDILPLTDTDFAMNLPFAHLAMLSLAKIFTETHDYFAMSSEWLIDGRKAYTQQSTAKHLAKIIVELTKLLEASPRMVAEARIAVLEWVGQLGYRLNEVVKTIATQSEVMALRATMLRMLFGFSFDELRCTKLLLNGIHRFGAFEELDSASDDELESLAKKFLASVRNADMESFALIWSAVPNAFYIRTGLLTTFADDFEAKQHRVDASDFSGQHFRTLTNLIFHQNVPSVLQDSTHDSEWVQYAPTFIGNAVGLYGERNIAESWKGMVDQLAQFCAENRMKTPFGKPLETFTKFENEIRGFVASALSRNFTNTYESALDDGNPRHSERLRARSDSLGSDDDEGGSAIARNENRKLTYAEEWFRVRLLLDFVESLDKVMFHAVRGSMFPVFVLSQAAQQFFQMNYTNCQSWISRIALPTMAVSYFTGNFSQIVRIANFLFAELSQKAAKSDKALKLDSQTTLTICWVVRGLVEMGATQSIRGVRRWVHSVFETPLEWIECAEHLSAARYETALESIDRHMKDENMHDQVRRALEEMKVKAIKCLRNGELTKAANVEAQFRMAGENGETTVAAFRKWQWEKAVALSSWDSLDAVEDTRNRSFPWEIDDRLDDMEASLVSLWGAHMNSNVRPLPPSFKGDVAHIGDQLSATARHALLIDDSPSLHNRTVALRLCWKAMQQRIDNRRAAKGSAPETVLTEFNFQQLLINWKTNTAERIQIGSQLCSWLDRLYGPNSPTSASAHREMSILARKSGNFALAHHHMRHASVGHTPAIDAVENVQRAFGLGGFQSAPPGFQAPPGFLPQSGMVHNIPKMDIRLALHTAKLHWLHPLENAENDRRESFIRLADCVCSHIEDASIMDAFLNADQQNNIVQSAAPFVGQNGTVHGTIPLAPLTKKQPVDQLVAKACLHLGTWSPMLHNTAEILLRKQAALPRMFYQQIIQTTELLLQRCMGIEGASALQGAFLMAASEQVASVKKAHKALTDWATNLSVADKNNEEELVRISPGEKIVLAQLGVDTDSKDGRECSTIEDLHLSVETSKKFCEKEAIQRVMLTPEFYPLWSVVKMRQYNLFEIALKASCRYMENCDLLTSKRSIDTVSVTLSVLRMLAHHAEWFTQAVGASWLERINEDVWKDIIPQLFARLSHPNVGVRSVICDILTTVASTSPHAVCYPAIVGSTNTRSTTAIASDEDDIGVGSLAEEDSLDMLSSTTERLNKKDLSVMTAGCQSIVDAIESKYPDLVHDVTGFINELQKINMLNEEKWMFVLLNLDHEMIRRVKQLDSERVKMEGYKHLTDAEKKAIQAEKTELLTSMVLRVVEDLYESTCKVQPETANEKQFLATYFDQLTSALEAFRKNRQSPVLETMNQRSSKKSSLCLHTQDMSAFLAVMTASQIPVPGQELLRFSGDSGAIVTVHRMYKTAFVLPTKTRPKKINFIGSDGKEYPFLFKGQEDLHLDERVMQLLQVCNLMLLDKKNLVQNDTWPAYYSKTYSVTPLGTRSGLIQWVDGATPLFQVYRKWKARQNGQNHVKIATRERSKEATSGQPSKSKTKTPPPQEERPMDSFFRHLKAVFNEQGIADVLTDRQRWPLTALQQVLRKLIDETPRDLLARELWMKAGTCMTWWRITQRFARTTAVMSMVGSVLGLGDRHLDNILLDFSTGNVIHVDYNVSFEKGKNLRVPETVPFRLTGNLAQALGPTTVEGTFRESCKHALSVVRSGKDVILQMLEAFIYDPLVDWSAQEQVVSTTSVNVATVLAVYGTDERSEIALPLTQALLRVRIKELKVPWMSACKNLDGSLRKVSQVLRQMHDYASRFGVAEAKSRFEKERVEAGVQLKAAVTEHHQLMQLFKPLLRSLSRADERYATFLRGYKEKFSEPLVRGHKLLDDKDADYGKCVDCFGVALNNITQVHESLVELESITDLRAPGSVSLYASTFSEANTPMTPGDTLSSISDFETRSSRNVEEQQNVHAKSVSKRIRRKLEGYEAMSAPSKSHACRGKQPTVETGLMTPAEQVDFLINEATSRSNLALMYEGWTAWV